MYLQCLQLTMAKSETILWIPLKLLYSPAHNHKKCGCNTHIISWNNLWRCEKGLSLQVSNSKPFFSLWTITNNLRMGTMSEQHECLYIGTRFCNGHGSTFPRKRAANDGKARSRDQWFWRVTYPPSLYMWTMQNVCACAKQHHKHPCLDHAIDRETDWQCIQHNAF